MEYQVAKPGRIIIIHLSEGDELYECIESVAKKENIKAASVLITGGIRKADVVVGPKQEKPKSVRNEFFWWQQAQGLALSRQRQQRMHMSFKCVITKDMD